MIKNILKNRWICLKKDELLWIYCKSLGINHTSKRIKSICNKTESNEKEIISSVS